MIIAHKLDLDFANRSLNPRITVSQDDKLSRKLVLSLKANGVPVSLPAECRILVRYRKPDGTAGTYDTLPDGTPAWNLSADTLTVALAEQVCTVPGTVALVITVISGAMELNSFSITLEVIPIPKQLAPSQDYINITGFIPQSKLVKEGQYLCVSKVAADGTVAQVDSKDPPKSAYEYAQAGGFIGSEAEFTAKIAAQIDTSLRNSGAVAESKATGDAIAECSQEIALQRTRIDNLTQLPAGSTTADAELLDIRVGLNGTSYDTAGNAVRGQAEEIYQILGPTELPISGWTDTFYIHADTGSVTANGLYSHSDYIPVHPFGSIDVFSQTSATALAVGLGFYDINKTLVALYKSEAGFDIHTPIRIPVPENAVYVIVSCRTDTKTQCKVIGRDMITPQRTAKEYTYITTSWTEGAYIKKSNGKETALAVYSCSDYILVSPGDRIYARVSAANDVSGYAFYDKDKKFLAGGTVCSFSFKSWQSGVVIVPGNAKYFRITHAHADGEAQIAVIPADSSYHHLLCKAEELGSTTAENSGSIAGLRGELTKTNDNIDAMVHAVNYAFAMDRIMCIGDSLTSGAYYANGLSGATIVQSYPTMLHRMLRPSTLSNAGYSGYSASNWYQTKCQLYQFADHDSFIIWLGSNNGLTDTLAEDVNAFHNYANYANTETGYYCKIIETILEQNPDAFIVLCTVFASKGNVAVTNSVIAQIAEKYGCLLIDMSDLTVANFPELHAGINNMHFGKAGNIFVAQRILRKLNEHFAADPLACEFGMRR